MQRPIGGWGRVGGVPSFRWKVDVKADVKADVLGPAPDAPRTSPLIASQLNKFVLKRTWSGGSSTSSEASKSLPARPADPPPTPTAVDPRAEAPRIAPAADSAPPPSPGHGADDLIRTGEIGSRSLRAIRHAKSFSTDAAIRVLDGELARLGEAAQKGEAGDALRLARSFLVGRREDFRAPSEGEGELSAVEIDEYMGASSARGAEADGLREIANGLTPPGLEGKYRLPARHAAVPEQAMMELFLRRAFADAGVKGPPKLAKTLAAERRESLNAEPWSPIVGDVRLRFGMLETDLRSCIRPQSDLGPTFNDLRGGGVNCHMSQGYKHVTNLAVTSAEVDGQEIFSGIRHGTLTAYDISADGLRDLDARDPKAFERMVADLLPARLLKAPGGRMDRLGGALHLKDRGVSTLEATVARMRSDGGFRQQAADAMRAEATRIRALDVVKSALVSDPRLLGAALKGEVPTVSLSSVGLLTPEAIRSAGGLADSKGANERLMLQDQLNAWNALGANGLDGTGQPLAIRDADGVERRVKVKVDVLAFNFGVNQGAVNKLGAKVGGRYVGLDPSSAGALSGWSMADRQNAASMGKLMERADAWLADGANLADSLKWEQVHALRGQIHQIWSEKSYKEQGQEPYKLVSRLAVLSDMIGIKACWNCKSGKDRTGQCEVEAKYLAAQMHHSRRWGFSSVPQYTRVRGDVERNNLFNMAVHGGNFELQTLNTGAPGFKLNGVPAVENAYGGSKTSGNFQTVVGISKYFGS